MTWLGLSGLKRKSKALRESATAGFFDTGNVSATVNGKLVLSWAGTPSQKDDALKMLPVLQQKLMPGVSPEAFADATIASIHDAGMAQDNHARNIQSIAMLWRLFTTPVNRDLPGVTFGDLVATNNLHVAFELHEQPNDQFKVTWTVNTMPSRPLWLPWRVILNLVRFVRGWKRSWEETYAANVYAGLVEGGGPAGEFSAEKLTIPAKHLPHYHVKALTEREMLCFAAVMQTTDRNTVPHLLPLIGAFGRLVLVKQQTRFGRELDLDALAERANLNAYELRSAPLEWAKKWLAEFECEEPGFAAAFFADHSLKQLDAMKHALVETRNNLNWSAKEHALKSGDVTHGAPRD